MAEKPNPVDQLTGNIEKMEQLVQKQIQQTEQLIASTQKDIESFTSVENSSHNLDDHMKTIQEQVEKTLSEAIKSCDDGLKQLIQNQLSSIG